MFEPNFEEADRLGKSPSFKHENISFLNTLYELLPDLFAALVIIIKCRVIVRKSFLQSPEQSENFNQSLFFTIKRRCYLYLHPL